MSVFLYALLTVLFTLAGLAYIVLPQLTLKWTFGWAAAQGLTECIWAECICTGGNDPANVLQAAWR